jgi:hypothetical protein
MAEPNTTAGAPAKQGEVLPPVNLPDLAKQINDNHAAIVRDAKSILTRAIAAGQALAIAKAAIPDGTWLRWLRENCTVSERTAQLYIQLAEYRRQLQAEADNRSATIADQTLNEAIRSLRARKAGKKKPPKEEPPKAVVLGGVDEPKERPPTLEDLLANHAADELFVVLKDTWDDEQLNALCGLIRSHIAEASP